MTLFNSSNIYNSKEKEIFQDGAVTDTILYTIAEHAESSHDNHATRNQEDEKVYAKQIQRKDHSKRYVIRKASNGQLYNPTSMYGEEQERNFLNKVCRSDDKCMTVNNRTCNLYLQFLDNKNPAYLKNAKKEVK